jgi:hypothetical protein
MVKGVKETNLARGIKKERADAPSLKHLSS